MGDLEEMIAALRKLGAEDIEASVAAKAAPAILEGLQTTADAATSPEGAPWAPRKSGGRAYVHAAGRLSAKAIGPLIRVTLEGPEVYGHYGVRGMPVRAMLPDAGAGVPPSVARALDAAATAVFDEAVK
jgi:hypothetical protein